MDKTLANGRVAELEQLALRVRSHCIRMATDGGCFLGASLSCTDILVYLYSAFLNVRIENFKDPKRDYFLLSKGHDVPALYGLFAELGFIEKDRLANHLKTNDHIYWHPNRNIPGVEFHSGSLGHCLSVSMGIAYNSRLDGLDNKVAVLLGDGEIDEGSVWEAALVAAAHKLDNLIAIVDRNFFQANFRTEELIPLGRIEEKFRAFGWYAVTIDGHNFQELHKAFTELPLGQGRPMAVICETKRGKGLPSIEEKANRWFCNFTAEEIQALEEELLTKHEATITSAEIIAR
jgi:transketolase